MNQPVCIRIQKKIGLEASGGNESGSVPVRLNRERLERDRFGRRSERGNIGDGDEVMVRVLLLTLPCLIWVRGF